MFVPPTQIRSTLLCLQCLRAVTCYKTSMHKLNLHNFLTYLGLSALLLGAFVVHAQSLGVDPVQYVVSPQLPGPNQKVQIEAQGVGDFMGNSTITWQQDGKTVLQGVGARDYSFTTGALGSQTHVHVEIDSPNQGSFTHDFVFLPSTVDLVWEADTTVPPLYRGKALYSAGSSVRVVAYPTIIVNGKQVSSKSLSYQWSHNNTPAPAQSGMGLSSFSFQGSELQSSEDVSVAVYLGSSQVASGDISIPAQDPQLVLYDKDPLRGVLWDTALPSTLSLGSAEFTVAAVPYYFANESSQGGSLGYSWTLNGNPTSGPQSTQGLLTLRQSGSGTGAAQLGVTQQNNDNDKLVQAAQAMVQIVFGQSSSAPSLFGL